MMIAYSVLSQRDESSILDLYCRSRDYFLLSEGQVPDSCDELLYDLPPNKTLKDKVSLGIYRANRLVGVVDCIKGFPDENTCMIGLLLIDPNFRNLGIGQSAYGKICSIAKKAHLSVMRIGVLAANQKAIEFWSKIGFSQVEIKGPVTYGRKRHMIHVMEQRI